MGNTKNFRHG